MAERWLRGIVPVRLARYAAAFGGVLVSATSWTVWNQSTVNEKVYTVSLLSIALVMWLVVHWGDDEPGPHRDRWLVLIAYVLALTSTNHLMGFLALPALLVYVVWTDWRTLSRPWAIVTFYALLLAVSGKWIAMLQPGSAEGGIILVVSLAVAGYALWRSPRDPLVYLGLLAVVVGVSLNYVWLPMRAGQYPPINEGEPIGFFSQALRDVLNRVQYGKPRAHGAAGDLQRPARQLLAVLHLAVRARLGPALGRRDSRLRGPWPEWARRRSGSRTGAPASRASPCSARCR